MTETIEKDIEDIEIFHTVRKKMMRVKDLKIVGNMEPDMQGGSHYVEMMTFTVLGNVREYPDFVLLKAFEEFNPHIDIKLINRENNTKT